jgi:hypothetical protein
VSHDVPFGVAWWNGHPRVSRRGRSSRPRSVPRIRIAP